MLVHPSQASLLLTSVSVKRNPSAEQLQELGQLLSLLHTSPPRTVFDNAERACGAVVAARELYRRALWGLPRGNNIFKQTAYPSVDTAIQLVTILLDAAERCRRDGDMEQAAALLDESLRVTRATRLLVPFMNAASTASYEAEDYSLAMSRLLKAEAEACMRFALLLVPARAPTGDLIGLHCALQLINDAASSEEQSCSNDWQATQMIGLVRAAICTALSWQSQLADRQLSKWTASVLDGIRPIATADESGNPLTTPVEITVSRPVAADAGELEAKLSVSGAAVRFGNLGEANDASEDEAHLPPGAGVMIQCFQPCIEAYVTEEGAVRLRCTSTHEDLMVRELSFDASGEPCQLDLVRLETSQELLATLRMLKHNLAKSGTADTASVECLPALHALFRLTLDDTMQHFQSCPGHAA